MTFGEALERAKLGAKMAREGWNGKDMWITWSPGNEELSADKFFAPANRLFAESQGGYAKVLPCMTMKTACNHILIGWLASQTDMLAEDWFVVV